MLKVIVGMLALVLSGCVVHAGAEVYDVSMIQLVATPEKYDGRQVRVIGFLRLEFEGDALYLHREDYENGLSRNAVFLSIPGGTPAGTKERVDNNYVIIEGTFDSKMKGHGHMYSGVIKDIKRLDPWR